MPSLASKNGCSGIRGCGAACTSGYGGLLGENLFDLGSGMATHQYSGSVGDNAYRFTPTMRGLPKSVEKSDLGTLVLGRAAQGLVDKLASTVVIWIAKGSLGIF